jgi:hypothetical protein
MPEPVRVFVCYASQDHAFAEQLVNDLRAAGAEMWWDISSINEGDFLHKIDEALQHCAWLVLVLTPNAIASKWVKKEVYAAINRREQGYMKGVLPMLAAPTESQIIPPLWATCTALMLFIPTRARLISWCGSWGCHSRCVQRLPKRHRLQPGPQLRGPRRYSNG